MMPRKVELLYSGKAKEIYATDERGLVILHFTDQITSGNGQKKAAMQDKGLCNAAISAHLFAHLNEHGVETHFLKQIGPQELLAKKLTMLPLEVVVRNMAAGSLARRLGLPEGTTLKRPVLEFYLKDDALGDPLLNLSHIRTLEIIDLHTAGEIENTALKINSLLKDYLESKGIILVDFKLEFGLVDGRLVLGDEISPDTCRFWDARTNRKLDKDRFRRDLGEVTGAYREVRDRLLGGV